MRRSWVQVPSQAPDQRVAADGLLVVGQTRHGVVDRGLVDAVSPDLVHHVGALQSRTEGDGRGRDRGTRPRRSGPRPCATHLHRCPHGVLQPLCRDGALPRAALRPVGRRLRCRHPRRLAPRRRHGWHGTGGRRARPEDPRDRGRWHLLLCRRHGGGPRCLSGHAPCPVPLAQRRRHARRGRARAAAGRAGRARRRGVRRSCGLRPPARPRGPRPVLGTTSRPGTAMDHLDLCRAVRGRRARRPHPGQLHPRVRSHAGGVRPLRRCLPARVARLALRHEGERHRRDDLDLDPLRRDLPSRPADLDRPGDPRVQSCPQLHRPGAQRRRPDPAASLLPPLRRIRLAGERGPPRRQPDPCRRDPSRPWPAGRLAGGTRAAS